MSTHIDFLLILRLGEKCAVLLRLMKRQVHIWEENRLKDCQGQNYTIQPLNEGFRLDSKPCKGMLKARYIQPTPHPQTPARKTSGLFRRLHKETRTNCLSPLLIRWLFFLSTEKQPHCTSCTRYLSCRNRHHVYWEWLPKHRWLNEGCQQIRSWWVAVEQCVVYFCVNPWPSVPTLWARLC